MCPSRFEELYNVFTAQSATLRRSGIEGIPLRVELRQLPRQRLGPRKRLGDLRRRFLVEVGPRDLRGERRLFSFERLDAARERLELALLVVGQFPPDRRRRLDRFRRRLTAGRFRLLARAERGG